MCIGILYTVVIIYVAATERSSWFPCKYSEHMCSQKKVSWTYVCSILIQRRTNLLRDREKKNICTLCMYTHHKCSYLDLHSKVVACDRCDVRTSVWLSRIISTRALASSSTAQRRRWMNVCVCLRVWCGSREATEIAWVRIVIHARRVLAQKPSINSRRYIWSRLQIIWTNNFAS